MNAPRDLRDWLDLLEREDELATVEAEVDPHLELTEVVSRTLAADGPALLFRNPRGSEIPLLINQFGTERRTCLGLGVPSLNELATRLAGIAYGGSSGSDASERMRLASQMRRLEATAPRTARTAPCQEVVLEPNLDLLPIQTCWPGDPAPFITLPAVITRDPRTGVRNVGIYRMQRIDARTTFMHWQIHKDGAADWRGMGDRLDVAVALGCDPATTVMAAAPLPRGVDELAVAGFVRGEPVPMVAAKTIDLDVPANAEIILEGYVVRGELGVEGPFGDHTGYYSPAEPFPVLHLTAMTMRADAIYPSIVVGPPPAEDCWLGKVGERLAAPALCAMLPEVVDYDLPAAGAFQHCAIVAIRKAFPGHARKVMHAVWGTGNLCLLKSVVVVDEFVDPHDYEQVFFHVCANADPGRDVVLAEGPLDQLDHAALRPCYGGKIGIDATHKLPGEAERPWPERIVMSSDVRRMVDERWAEYGIGATQRHGGRSREQLPF